MSLKLVVQKNAPLLVLAVLMLGLVVYTSFAGKTSNPSYNTDRQTADNPPVLPANVFDAKISVPGTSVVLAYPKDGFYGLGAEIVTLKTDPGQVSNGVTISSTASYTAEKGAEFVTLTTRAGSLQTGEALETFVKSFVEGASLDAQYAKLDGKYEVIKGRQFFVFKVTEDATIWQAYVADANNLLTISLAYKLTEAPESRMAYKHNDQLFKEILSHIEFK